MNLKEVMTESRLRELRRQATNHIRAATTITVFPQELLALIELIEALRAEATIYKK